MPQTTAELVNSLPHGYYWGKHKQHGWIMVQKTHKDYIHYRGDPIWEQKYSRYLHCFFRSNNYGDCFTEFKPVSTP